MPGCFGQAIRFYDDPNSYLIRGQDDNVFDFGARDYSIELVDFWPTALFDLHSAVKFFAQNQAAPSFQGGAATNRVTIVVQGPHIAIYVNGEPLWHACDKMSVGGTVDLGIGACNNDPTPLRVRFDNLKLWGISDLPLPSP